MTRGMSELLAQRIERWIADEGLDVGTPLPERALAERFKVSRTPVRDALLRLADPHEKALKVQNLGQGWTLDINAVWSEPESLPHWQAESLEQRRSFIIT